jgi:hypothetical protein
MSRRLLAAVSVVLAMGVAPMAMAKAPPPPTTKAEALKRLQTWITAIGQFSAKFDLYYEHEVDFLGGLMESFTPASGYLVGDDRAAGEAWAATWVAEQRAKQAALKLERAALPTSPPAAPFPEMASQTKRLLGFRPAVVKAAEAMDVEADLYIASLEKAGRGDGDVPSLVRQTFGLTVSMLQAENETISRRAGALTGGHPDIAMTASLVSTNLGFISIYNLGRSANRGEALKAEAAKTAEAVRQMASQIETAAAGVERDARSERAEIASDVSMRGTALVGRFDRAMQTYSQSAATEREIAKGLRAAATEIEADGYADFDHLKDVLDVLQTQAGRRVEIQRERKKLLTGV